MKNWSPGTIVFSLLAMTLALAIAVIGIWQVMAPRHSGLPVLRLGGDFELQDSRGGTFRLAEQRGQLVVMTFAFASCPDICPLTLARFRAVLEALGPDARRVRFIMVSVDPARDTPERLQAYVTYFHPDFLGLTGSREQLAAVERLYGARVLIHDNGDVSHSDYIYLLDDEGQTRHLFDQQAGVDDMVDVIRRLLREARGRR